MADIVTGSGTELSLVVSEFNLGRLVSNARSILEHVRGKLEGYKAENYSGERITLAKRDKAELNAAAKLLNDQRIEYERKWMAPFDEFKGIVNEACTEIRKASAAIDAVVKEVEQAEKDAKRAEIEEYFASTGWTLFGLDRIFVPAWLNKTTSMKSIQAEIDARLKKTEDELSILEDLGEPDAKAHYLTTLDLKSAIAEANRIKANRKLLEDQKPAAPSEEPGFKGECDTCRWSGPGEECLSPRDCEEATNSGWTPREIEPAAAEVPEMMPEKIPAETTDVTYVLRVSGPWEKIKALRAYMDANGIRYEKL